MYLVVYFSLRYVGISDIVSFATTLEEKYSVLVPKIEYWKVKLRTIIMKYQEQKLEGNVNKILTIESFCKEHYKKEYFTKSKIHEESSRHEWNRTNSHKDAVPGFCLYRTVLYFVSL